MVVKRKLAAIIVIDIVGYSRLMREDEAGTYAAVRQLRDETLQHALAPHQGRLIKEMGDGFLLTFDSAVQAVECGVALQLAMAAHEKLELRIGVNVGDVIIEDNDVIGDGVNVAARLETICTPGGIAMSENVYEQVRDKLTLKVEKLEPQIFKNIDRPVEVRQWTGRLTALQAAEASDVSEKPSIAVLAFSNMSSNVEQEYFAEGIAEDIITALSRIERFFVVSRTSSFSFKNKCVGVKKIGEELGVRYVLEGSVRAAGDRLRVTAQLIEATSGRHIWAERYDRMSEDVFDIQDEITRSVVASIQTQIELDEGELSHQLERMSLPAWRLINIAWKMAYELSPEALPKAIDLALQAIALSPNTGRAYMVASIGHFHHALVNRPAEAEALNTRAYEYASDAVRLSPYDEYAYWARGLALGGMNELNAALADMERALELNVNCSLARGSYGSILARLGRSEEAIEETLIAIRSDPRNPSIFFRYTTLATSLFALGRFEEAIEHARRAIGLKPRFLNAYVPLICAMQALGREEEAILALDRCTVECGPVTIDGALRFAPVEEELRQKIRQKI